MNLLKCSRISILKYDYILVLIVILLFSGINAAADSSDPPTCECPSGEVKTADVWVDWVDENPVIQGGPNDGEVYDPGQGSSNTNLLGTDGADVIVGWNSDDVIEGRDKADTICGRDGDDDISGGDKADKICGGSGHDTISGDDGNDHIYGGSGNDTISGGDKNDHIYGGSGNDTISGGDKNDHIDGGSGNDEIIGNDGNDDLYGNDGNDIIDGNTGNDDIDGGDGTDLCYNGANVDNCVNCGQKDLIAQGNLSLEIVQKNAGDGQVALRNLDRSSTKVEFSGTLTVTILDTNGFDKVGATYYSETESDGRKEKTDGLVILDKTGGSSDRELLPYHSSHYEDGSQVGTQPSKEDVKDLTDDFDTSSGSPQTVRYNGLIDLSNLTLNYDSGDTLNIWITFWLYD